MLVLHRGVGATTVIDHPLGQVRVVNLGNDRVGFEGPRDVLIRREELLDRAAPVAAAAGDRGGGQNLGLEAAPTSLASFGQAVPGKVA